MLALASSRQVREKLAAIENFSAAVKMWELEQINKKLEEQGRVLNEVIRANKNATLFNKVAVACSFLATAIVVGVTFGKTWPVTVAWVTQLFA